MLLTLHNVNDLLCLWNKSFFRTLLQIIKFFMIFMHFPVASFFKGYNSHDVPSELSKSHVTRELRVKTISDICISLETLLLKCSDKPNFLSTLYWDEIKRKVWKSFKASNSQHEAERKLTRTHRETRKVTETRNFLSLSHVVWFYLPFRHFFAEGYDGMKAGA